MHGSVLSGGEAVIRGRRSRVGVFFRALRLLHYRGSFVRTAGLLRSFRERKPVDAAGAPLPWINYPAIHLLDERLRPEHAVFEYGAGYSTLYFAARCDAVTSVEHDRAWYEEVRRMAPGHVTLLYRATGPGYWDAAAETGGPYDLIVVDGMERARCLASAVRALAPGGVVLLDDAHREAYRSAVQGCRDAGFRSLRLVGPKPDHLGETECLLIYREGNCLAI